MRGRERRGNDRDPPARTPGSPERRSAQIGHSDDVELIAALRRGDRAAYQIYFERFHRLLLDYARRGGVMGAARDEFVEELLDDVALRLMTPGAPLPRNPRMYLLGAFRKKLVNVKRTRARRERAVRGAGEESETVGDHGRDAEVVAGCSQRMVREARGPDWEHESLSQVLERLGAALGERLSEDERLMLDAVAADVPQREIAEWLGVSHAVARKRLERLRARLTEVSMRFAGGLEPDDARELQRFFRRCRARIGASMITGPPTSSDDPDDLPDEKI